MVDMNRIVGTHHILLLVLDALRFDVARDTMAAGRTPNLARLLPRGWEMRHTPGTFTFPAHQAFFAGFLPTPPTPGPHPRLFAIRFGGSETTTTRTCLFEAPDIVHGLAGRGYHTICIGGVGFFNPASPLGEVLPGYFAESHWSPQLGVTEPRSTEHQFRLAAQRVAVVPDHRRIFMTINVSALHQPTHHYVPGATGESLVTQSAALAYVDTQVPLLLQALRQQGPWYCIICSDHGTCFGEDGYWGHRLAHPKVLEVPYAEAVVCS